MFWDFEKKNVKT